MKDVTVFTVDGAVVYYEGCSSLTYDGIVIQIVEDEVTHTFPLANVMQYDFTEAS